MTEQPTVIEAFSKVMESVQGIRKGERNSQQGFNFRGIDAVMNAVGPALREHGVVIVPTAQTIDVERYESKNGASMKNVTVLMQYTVHGPAGDTITGQSYGEAADSGDKAVSKAQSVAYRTFLLQGLTIPTDERDPDSDVHERATDPVRAAVEELVGAVESAGMEPGAFAAWALSARGPGINVRECRDVVKLKKLTQQVKDKGSELMAVPS